MCDRQCWRKGFKHYDIASVKVEDDGELHTMNVFTDWYNVRPSGSKVPASNNRMWKMLVAHKRSRGTLAARGLEQKIMEIHAAKKIYAKNVLKDATEAVSLGKERPETSPSKEEFAVLREKAWTCGCRA